MMSQRKLNLDELKVESFVTSFENEHDGTIRGGGWNLSRIDGCRSALIECYPILKTVDGCFISLACPSLVDGCPSAPSGCLTDITIVQTTPIQKY